jgi:hypothetical protein
MATLTSTPNDTTLKFSYFSSSASGNITWNLPDIPEGATVNSCTLTGTATASNSSINSIKINDQDIPANTSGTSFSIDLGTDATITSVTTSATKSKYGLYNVKFTNMTYTIDVTEAGTGGDTPTTNKIYLGSSNVKTIYIGNNIIKSIYIGTNKIL